MPDLAESLVLQFDNYLLDRPADVLLRLEPDGKTSRVADAVEESPRRQQGRLVINVSIGLGRSWRTTLGRAAL